MLQASKYVQQRFKINLFQKFINVLKVQQMFSCTIDSFLFSVFRMSENSRLLKHFLTLVTIWYLFPQNGMEQSLLLGENLWQLTIHFQIPNWVDLRNIYIYKCHILDNWISRRVFYTGVHVNKFLNSPLSFIGHWIIYLTFWNYIHFYVVGITLFIFASSICAEDNTDFFDRASFGCSVTKMSNIKNANSVY